MSISLTHLRALLPRVVCLGTHPAVIQSMLDYDYLCGRQAPSVAVVISQGRRQERYFWGEVEIEIPVLASVNELSAAQKAAANCLLNLQSGRRVLAGTASALRALPGLRVAALFAEQVPEAHALELAALARQREVLLVGPASVGLLVPGALKLGAIGGTTHQQLTAADVLAGGTTAVISTSGGMVNELMHAVTGCGLRVSFAVALGGDRFPATTPAEAFLLAEADSQTKQIIYFGELGGTDEYEIAKLIQAHRITKKVMAYIAGTVAELFDTPPQFGHAKALAQTADESARAKKAALRASGVQVLDRFGELAPTLTTFTAARPTEISAKSARTIGARRKHLLVSHLSGEQQGEMHLLGKDLLRTVEQNSLAGLVLSMLLGQQVSSKELIACTDYVLRLLADHGPYVSAAVNTMVAARAGKDLVSSLASGLLTIGPRFGGAINEAAGNWLRGVNEATNSKDFVDTFRAHGGIIPGIGHKKYRVDLPDPRVAALRQLVVHDDGVYLRFALGVQAVTTTKKGNLILNIDGAVAAILLDLLASELHYNPAQLQELVDIEFFNALFVLSRSIGLSAHYLDQRRHDEGLLRLSDQEISYLP